MALALAIERALGLATIQDLGRPGRMHEGLAAGGALVPSLLVAANRAVGNRDGTPAIEIFGRIAIRAERDIATSAGHLMRGQLVVVESEPRRVAYLAVRGGIAAELILGGYGTQLSAGIGAPLRAGTLLRVGDEPFVHGDVLSRAGASADAVPGKFSTEAQGGELVADAAAIAVIAGPDRDAFADDALVQLCSAPYRILPTSDRVGTRLEGPRVPLRSYAQQSRPMVQGAIEVPPDGSPIVLGPEHPTIGGYPIVAVVAHACLDRLFATRVGGHVRFTTA